MHRLVLVAGGTATLLSLAACGGSSGSATSSGTSSATGGSQPGTGTRAPRGAAGQLAQINGTNLILNTQSGDVTVSYGTSTTITRTRTGSLADIVTGSCIVALGQKDASGALTATSVRLSHPVNGACPTGAGPGGRRMSGNGTGTPANPPPGQPALSAAAGTVTAVSGTSITLQPASGTAQTITVPTTVRISESSAAAPSDLSVGECISAQGPRSSSGTVTAQSLSIVPAGPSGCFTGGRGFGGFGGGRFRGGDGGTGAGAGGTTGA
jgi:Domain of unknown function (DUF5666)